MDGNQAAASLREAYARGDYEVKFKDGSVWRPPRPPVDANQVVEAANELSELITTNVQKLEEEKDNERSPKRKKSYDPRCARKETVEEAWWRGWTSAMGIIDTKLDDYRVEWYSQGWDDAMKVKEVSEVVLTQAPLAFAREQSSVATHEEMANGNSRGCRCCDSRGCLCCNKGNA